MECFKCGYMIEHIQHIRLIQSGLTAIILIIITLPLFAQGKKTIVTPDWLSDTKVIFKDFITKAVPPEQGEFETTEEYNKRLPKPWDAHRPLFFRVFVPNGAKEYYYIADKQILSILGGRIYHYLGRSKKLNTALENGLPIIIDSEIEIRGIEDYENAFRNNIKVEKFWSYQYILNVLNDKDIPVGIYNPDITLKTFEEEMNFNDRKFDDFINGDINVDHTLKVQLLEDVLKSPFKYPINLKPDEAKDQSANLWMIVGVYLLGYDKFCFECDLTHEPTVKEPQDFANFVSIANCYIGTIILYNCKDGKIVSQIFVKNPFSTKN